MEDDLSLPLLRVDKQDEARNSVGSSMGQTLFNMVNLFLGVGLLSQPYALHKGGWFALVPLYLSCVLFCLSAHLIVRAFDRMPPSTQRTYPELGAHAGGEAGRRLVVGLALIELFGGGCIVLLVIWQQMLLLLPANGLWGYTPLQLAALASSACMAPTLLFRHFKSMSRLSMLGFSSSVLVVAVMLSLLPLDPHRERMPQQPPPGHTLFSAGVLQSMGIFAVSVSGHSTLPSMRASMRTPANFPRVLNSAFAIMLVAYAALASAGYWYFGDLAAPVVTTNLAQDSVYSGRALLGVVTVDRGLALLILMSCFTKYPVIVMVLQDMVLSLFPATSTPRDGQGSLRTPRQGVIYAVRYAVFAAGVSLAYFAHSFLGCVISLVGGLASISCSLLLPTAFFARLAWKDLGQPARAGLAALLVGGSVLVCSITAQNVADIAAHMRQQQGGGGGGGGLGAQGWLGVAPWVP